LRVVAPADQLHLALVGGAFEVPEDLDGIGLAKRRIEQDHIRRGPLDLVRTSAAGPRPTPIDSGIFDRRICGVIEDETGAPDRAGLSTVAGWHPLAPQLTETPGSGRMASLDFRRRQPKLVQSSRRKTGPGKP
jgi:hypothetical protein